MACDANTAMSRGLEQTQYEKSPILSTATASVTHACRGSFFTLSTPATPEVAR